jgi:hypothetical protein
MIEIGICVALVVDLSLTKLKLSEFLIGVGLLEDLVHLPSMDCTILKACSLALAVVNW